MNEVDFVFDNYIYFSYRQIERLLAVYKDRKIVIEDHEIRGVALYFKVSDETIAKIESRELDLTNYNVVNKCLDESGPNIHFFLLVADGTKTILKGLRQIMKKENPKSVSWFSPDMKQFFIRRSLCLQS